MELQYPDIGSGGCDLCAGVSLAPSYQSCDHRCTCGRPLTCEGHGGDRKGLYRALAVACANSALWAIERGSDVEAGDAAKDCVTACRLFQLEGGQPWE